MNEGHRQREEMKWDERGGEGEGEERVAGGHAVRRRQEEGQGGEGRKSPQPTNPIVPFWGVF